MSLPITLNPGAMHLIASWRSQAAQGKAFANAKKGLLLLAFVLLCGPLDAGQTRVPPRSARSPAAVAPKVKAALNRISADSLRGHLSFIASDLLEGRNTPSRGLDIAAEYIAAQFRRAGLEPAGDDGYFQTAEYLSISSKSDGAELVLEYGGNVRKPDFAVGQPALVDLSHAAAVKLISENAAEL